jgi:hypothetical protein
LSQICSETRRETEVRVEALSEHFPPIAVDRSLSLYLFPASFGPDLAKARPDINDFLYGNL